MKHKYVRRGLALLSICFLCLTIFATVLDVGQKNAALATDAASSEELPDLPEDYFLDDPDEEDIDEMDFIDMSNADLETNDNLPNDYFNIMLCGLDTRVRGGRARSDSMLICSIHRKTGEIKLTSIARDSYLYIGGNKGMQRINAAYVYGGPEMAMWALNHNFDMNISYYITVDFWGLVDIVDAIGGVDVELTNGEIFLINSANEKMDGPQTHSAQLTRGAGVRHLDGAQALAFSRIRHLDNDFMRTGRQRKVLEAIGNKVLTQINPMQIAGLIDAMLPYVRTNLKLNDILMLGMAVLGGEPMKKAAAGEFAIPQLLLPATGYFKFEMNQGQSVLGLDLKGNTRLLHEFIYGQVYSRK